MSYLESEVVKQYEKGYSLRKIGSYYAEETGYQQTKSEHQITRIIYEYLLNQKNKGGNRGTEYDG